MLPHLVLFAATAWGRLFMYFIPESPWGMMAFDSPTETQTVLCLLKPASLAQGLNASRASQKEFLSSSPGGFGSLVSVQTIIIKAVFKHAFVCRVVQWGVGGSRRRVGDNRMCWGGSEIGGSLFTQVLMSCTSSQTQRITLKLHHALIFQFRLGKSAPPSVCQHRCSGV